MLNSIVTNDGVSQSIQAQGDLGYFIEFGTFGVSDIEGDLDPTRTSPNTEWYNAAISSASQINDNTVQVILSIPPGAFGTDKEVKELYLYGKDKLGNPFLFAIAKPVPSQLYTPSATLNFRLQFTLQNINVDSAYVFSYTQALEIATHDDDPNAHPFLQEEMMNKAGIFANILQREYVGQMFDQFAVSAAVDSTVDDLEIVYWNTVQSKYYPAVQDGSGAENGIGIYLEDLDTVVFRGVVDYVHSLAPFTNLFLSKSVAGAITTNYSNVQVGYALANNKIFVEIRQLIKYAEIAGGGGGAGSFMPILGEVAPLEDVIDGLEVLRFDDESSQEIYFNFKVPEKYIAGSKLVLSGGAFYCENVNTGTVLFKAQTALLKKGSNTLGVYPNIHTSTNLEVIVAASAGDQNLTGDIDLTDATGKINSVLVDAGDMLRIKLFRDNANESSSALDDALVIKTCFEPVKILA